MILTAAFIIFLCGCVTYRVGRFVVLDDLIEETRNTVLNWLTTGEGYEGEGSKRPIIKSQEPGLWMKLPLWRRKLHDLLTCPFCVTGWISGGAVLIAWLFYPLPLPWFSWLAAWTIGLGWWNYIDHEE